MTSKRASSISSHSSAKTKRGLLSWLPPESATFVYTVFLKPRPIRALAQTIVKQFIPEQITLNGVKVCLNRKDPIVSGALALGCYETHLLDQFVELLEEGMVVVDIGANIGLYTVLSAHKVGREGKVIAIEPEPTNCSFIHKSLKLNGLVNAEVHNAAVSDKNGEIELFLCADNKADHRIYNESGTRESVKTKSVRLDDLLGEELLGKIDVIKMDIQGAEALALDGMKKALTTNPRLRFIMEFWPWGLKKAGSDPAKLLRDIRALGFEIFEFDSRNDGVVPVDDRELVSRSLERQHANLFMARSEAAITALDKCA